MSTPGRFVQVPPNSTGPKINNYAITAWVDNQDGNGPILQTVFLQATAVVPVDVNGNVMEPDEAYLTADWKRMMLDELRAIRLGMQRLNSSRLADLADDELSLIEEAQQRREELEDQPIGQTAGIAAPGPNA